MNLRFLLTLPVPVLTLALASCEQKKVPEPNPAEAAKEEKSKEDQEVHALHKFAVKIRAIRVAASASRTAEEIAPYNEALSWHEYEIKEVLGGNLDAKKVRVAHWTVLRGKDVPQDETLGAEVELTLKPFDPNTSDLEDVPADDELEILAEEPPRFLDLKAISGNAPTPEALRYDYGGSMSNQMQIYWKLRSQLELVVLGNSHASRALLTSDMLDADNKQHPKALNMGAGGADGYLQCLIAKEYVLPLPKLKTVVWMVSARTFNKLRKSELTNQRGAVFQNSPGYGYDQDHRKELWPVPQNQPVVSTAELKGLNLIGVDPWGWTGNDRVARIPGSRQEQEAYHLEKLNRIRFEFDEDAIALFSETVKAFTAKGIRVFIVTSPIHPLSQNTDAVDPDGSTREGLKKTVASLKDIMRSDANVWFHDTNRGGTHQFPHEEFYDADHLNTAGAKRFTAWVREWMTRVENLPPRQIGPTDTGESAAPATE